MSFKMTVTDAITASFLLANGKAVPPAVGSTKYVKLQALLNYYQNEWADEADTYWLSLRSVFTLPSITATDTYAIPATVGRVSGQEGDFVRIYHTDGISESDYTLVPITRLYDSDTTINNYGKPRLNANGTCAQVGDNIVFSRAFVATDPQFGGTLKIAGYTFPATLVNPTDVIAVDKPQWLCARVAAEFIRTDVTRVQLYGSLIDQAKEAMDQMKSNNSAQDESVYTGSFRPLGSTWD